MTYPRQRRRAFSSQLLHMCLHLRAVLHKGVARPVTLLKGEQSIRH